MRNILYLLLGIVLFSACASNEIANSGDVKQSEIYQSYAVTYDEESNETYIKATYRFGGKNGTTLVLTPPSNVTFNGEGMTRYESDFAGAYYKIAQVKPLANGMNCTFVFTDTDKKIFTNSIKFNPVLIGGVPNSIGKENPLKFTMMTNPLAYGEKIIIELKDSNHSAVFEVPTQQPKRQFVLPAKVLKKLSGEVKMQVTRSYNIMLSDATDEGGTIRFEYKTKEYKFTIN